MRQNSFVKICILLFKQTIFLQWNSNKNTYNRTIFNRLLYTDSRFTSPTEPHTRRNNLHSHRRADANANSHLPCRVIYRAPTAPAARASIVKRSRVCVYKWRASRSSLPLFKARTRGWVGGRGLALHMRVATVTKICAMAISHD